MVNGINNEKESVIRVTRLSGVAVYALSGSDKKNSVTHYEQKQRISFYNAFR